MANTSLSPILVILFWGLTLATGRRLSPLTTTTATFSSSPTDGICSSMVKTQAYTCEEHLVCTVLPSLSLSAQTSTRFTTPTSY